MTSLVFSVISSMTILFCIALQNDLIVNKCFIVVFPILFWLGLIFEQFFLWRANKIRKKIEGTGRYERALGRPGIVSFFQNRAGAVSDILLGFSFLCLVIFIALQKGENSMQVLLITVLVLTFRFHCILNGRNFKYKDYLEKRMVLTDEQKH